MEYYSAVKGNEVLIHATTGVNLKNMVRGRNNTKGHVLYGAIYI